MTTPMATSATTVKNSHESGARFGTRSIALQEYVVESDAPYRSCRYEQLRRLRQGWRGAARSPPSGRPDLPRGRTSCFGLAQEIPPPPSLTTNLTKRAPPS